MPISPLGAGDGRAQTWTLTTDTGIFSLAGLQNSNIAMHLLDIRNNNALYICTGAWAITGDGSAGKAVFTPSPQDLLGTNPLGKPGVYKVYPVVTLSTGAVPLDAQFLEIVSEP